MTARFAAAGFSAFAAIADTPGAAWAAALSVSTGGHRHRSRRRGAAMAFGPAGGGVAPAARHLETLHRLGLRRIGDLVMLPRAPLAARFGPHLPNGWTSSTGDASEPIGPEQPLMAYRARLAFPEPIGRIEDVEAALVRLIDSLCTVSSVTARGARRSSSPFSGRRHPDRDRRRHRGTGARCGASGPPVRRAVRRHRRRVRNRGHGLAVPQVDPLTAQQIELPADGRLSRPARTPRWRSWSTA